MAEAVEARLDALLTAETRRWGTVDAGLTPPFGALRDYTLAGGKRLRPAFCYWAWVGAGGREGEPVVVDAGAALEMLHTAALIHDDIIDRSSRRHGVETVHVRFAGRHRAADWAGDDGRFGEGVAILIGDLALVYSSRLMAAAPAAAAAVFEEMRIEVNVGQYLDVLGTAAGPDAESVARAQQICRYKTAKYTIERPLHIGAAVARGDSWRELEGPLSDFGLPLGEAFQLRDDLLGTFGDPAVTGKPVGDDLRQAKPTMLAALAAERDPEFARRLADARRSEPDDAAVAALLGMVEACGARAEVEQRLAELRTAAEAALDRLPFQGEAAVALRQLSAYVAGRDR
jgi:geranylgeranyl diphosphate synthase type I